MCGLGQAVGGSSSFLWLPCALVATGRPYPRPHQERSNAPTKDEPKPHQALDQGHSQGLGGRFERDGVDVSESPVEDSPTGVNPYSLESRWQHVGNTLTFRWESTGKPLAMRWHDYEAEEQASRFSAERVPISSGPIERACVYTAWLRLPHHSVIYSVLNELYYG